MLRKSKKLTNLRLLADVLRRYTVNLIQWAKFLNAWREVMGLDFQVVQTGFMETPTDNHVTTGFIIDTRIPESRYPNHEDYVTTMRTLVLFLHDMLRDHTGQEWLVSSCGIKIMAMRILS